MQQKWWIKSDINPQWNNTGEGDDHMKWICICEQKFGRRPLDLTTGVSLNFEILSSNNQPAQSII